MGDEQTRNAELWDALARVVGYNELCKSSQTVGEKMYLRLARSEAEKEYTKLGGEVVYHNDVPIITVATRPPFIALTENDLALMRAAVAEYDLRKEKGE